MFGEVCKDPNVTNKKTDYVKLSSVIQFGFLFWGASDQISV